MSTQQLQLREETESGWSGHGTLSLNVRVGASQHRQLCLFIREANAALPTLNKQLDASSRVTAFDRSRQDICAPGKRDDALKGRRL